jgi:hypothetical protein
MEDCSRYSASLAASIYKRVFRERWLQLRRSAVRSAAFALYCSYIDYAMESASLHVVGELSDEEVVRGLFGKQEDELELKSD